MANVYKWVDDGGNTHYSQYPPPNRHSVEIDKNYLHSDIDTEKHQLKNEQKRDEFNKRHQERQDKKKQAQQEKRDRGKLNQACEKARAKLKNLMADRQVRKKVGDTYTMMTDKQRKKDITKLKKKLKEQCS